MKHSTHRKINITICICICIWLCFFISTPNYAQNPERVFNDNSQYLGIVTGWGNCSVGGQPNSFEVTSGRIIQLSCDYAIPIKKWYKLEVGAYCGIMYYNVKTQGCTNDILNSSRRFVVSLPVCARRFFPLDNKISLSAKIGVELSELLWGSSFNVNSHNKNQTRLNVEYGSDFLPQFNVLSSVGIAYTLKKSNNFILFEIGVGCNILNPIQYKFQYIDLESSNDWIIDNFTAKYAKSITFSLKYNFKIERHG